MQEEISCFLRGPLRPSGTSPEIGGGDNCSRFPLGGKCPEGAKGELWFSKRPQDHLQHTPNIAHHILIAEPERPESLGRVHPVTPEVFRRIGMSFTIDLDQQPVFETGKVSNPGWDGMLATKPVSSELSPPQIVPEPPFRRRHVVAVFAGMVAQGLPVRHAPRYGGRDAVSPFAPFGALPPLAGEARVSVASPIKWGRCPKGGGGFLVQETFYCAAARALLTVWASVTSA